MIRKAVCLHCGEKWHPINGTMYEWWRRHAQMHGLKLPYREEGEVLEKYRLKFAQFCNKNFTGLIINETEATPP